jgi:ketosteroid isomerase-like protein
MSRRYLCFRFLALIALASLVAVFLATPVLARDDLRTEKAVIQTLHRACEAYERGDVEAMKQLLTEDFTLTNSAGTVTTRQDDIDLASNGRVQYEVFRNDAMKARLHGDAAIVTGRTIVKGSSGRNAFDAEFQFTDTLVLQDGKWRVASSHVSLVKSDVLQEPTDLKR